MEKALKEIGQQTGLPSHKVSAYVKVFEKREIFNKTALFLLTRDELNRIASECDMGAPTKALIIELWATGTKNNVPNLHPKVVGVLPAGEPPTMKEDDAR